MSIVICSGSYRGVIQQLGLADDFDETPLTPGAYDEIIQADLPRMCYATDGDLLEMKRRLANIADLDPKKLIYRQGDLDGRFFSQSARKTQAHTALLQSALEEDKQRIGENLAFSYVDEKGDLCGFSMDYYNESQFIISVIKGVNKPIDEREVHYFTQPEFIPEQASTKPETLAPTNLVQCVEKATNCTKVNKLLKEIITKEGTVLKEPFLRLKGRLSPDKNIDDKQSFFQRNAGNLILVGICFLAVVAVLLTLTGVLAPIGLTLGAGFGTVIAIAAAGGAAVLGAERTVKIISLDREQEVNIESAQFDGELDKLNELRRPPSEGESISERPTDLASHHITAPWPSSPENAGLEPVGPDPRSKLKSEPDPEKKTILRESTAPSP